MKVLLDANLPVDLRELIIDHQVATVGFLELKHLQNGKLLAAAAERGFEVFVTADRGFASQQNLDALPLAVLLLQFRSTKYQHLAAVIPSILAALAVIQPRTLLRVPQVRPSR